MRPKKSGVIERESISVANETAENQDGEDEEEKERVEDLIKSARMVTKRGGDASEDEEFYSVLNPQIQLSKINNRTMIDKTLEGGTMFHTVIADDTQDLDKDEEVKLQDEQGVLKYLDGQDATENTLISEPNPFVQKLMKENSAFKGLEIPFVSTRDCLPSELPQNIGEKAWNYTGVNTLEVPLSYHEPLSFLQKLCEQFEYSELLDQADDLSDPLLRMAYTIAFVISGYHTTSRRLTKPFDALLGETYEYSSDNSNFRFVAEQTCIEPPITVYYGASDHFEVNGSISMKTEFLGKCVEVKLEGKNEIRLKRSGDVYVFTRPITSLDHIITGKYCINNYGEMRFKNLKTQENATVSLLKRSWDEKSVNRLEGYIKDSKGQFVYKVSGKWDEEISIEHLQTKESRLIWKRKMLDTPEKNFGFTDLALQLNYLYNDLLNQLPQTDSRFRPDVRAIENGDYELANTEKRRLKEKEQKLVKVLRNNNTPYKPKWFNPVKVEEGAERFFLFNNKYFNQKLNDPDTFDLYN